MFATLAPSRGRTLPPEHPEHADSNLPPPQPPEPDSHTSVPIPPTPGTTEEPSTAPQRQPSRGKRARAYVRRGFTMTVLVLLVVGTGTAAYAFHLRPDGTIPQVGSWNIDIALGPGHYATSPMQVAFDMRVEEPQPGKRPYQDLFIRITSPDLNHPGWTLSGWVPKGVELFGQGRVVPHPGPQDFVVISPGAAQRGTASVILTWPDLNSGPLRIQDANLVAIFPELEDEPTTSSGNTPVPTSPSVTLTRELQPGEVDYAFLGGQQPNHEDPGAWYWDPANSSYSIFSSLTIEAQSATMEEQSHTAEFLSGVFFGVAAAALIAALQEFLNSARKRERQPDEASA
jgi:hypothetical protein